MDAELLALQAELVSIQSAPASTRIPERMVIDLVSLLASPRLGLLPDLVHGSAVSSGAPSGGSSATAGMTLMTTDFLAACVLDEASANRGRLSLSTLPDRLQVSQASIARALPSLLSSKQASLAAPDLLVTPTYVNRVVMEVREKVCEEGTASFVSLAEQFDLPLRFLKDLLVSALSTAVAASAVSVSDVGVSTSRYKDRCARIERVRRVLGRGARSSTLFTVRKKADASNREMRLGAVFTAGKWVLHDAFCAHAKEVAADLDHNGEKVIDVIHLLEEYRAVHGSSDAPMPAAEDDGAGLASSVRKVLGERSWKNDGRWVFPSGLERATVLSAASVAADSEKLADSRFSLLPTGLVRMWKERAEKLEQSRDEQREVLPDSTNSAGRKMWRKDTERTVLPSIMAEVYLVIRAAIKLGGGMSKVVERVVMEKWTSAIEDVLAKDGLAPPAIAKARLQIVQALKATASSTPSASSSASPGPGSNSAAVALEKIESVLDSILAAQHFVVPLHGGIDKKKERALVHGWKKDCEKKLEAIRSEFPAVSSPTATATLEEENLVLAIDAATCVHCILRPEWFAGALEGVVRAAVVAAKAANTVTS
eukprot:ANDGO_04661.mRNA.1 UFL1 family protein